MHKQFKAALGFLVAAAILPLHSRAFPQGSSGELLNAGEVRKAEVDAKTASDHLRLAAYYRSKAEKTQTKLAKADDLVNYWSKQPGMDGRTKVPNPYASARTLAEHYRWELQKLSKLAANQQKLAANQQKMAKSLQASENKSTP